MVVVDRIFNEKDQNRAPSNVSEYFFEVLGT